jgi:hypothetical protein
MPSKTPAQAKLMRAACHNADIAKKHHIPQKTACEFVRKDEQKKQHERYSGKPAQEGVSVHSSAAVSSTGYVAPNGQPPFKVF